MKKKPGDSSRHSGCLESCFEPSVGEISIAGYGAGAISPNTQFFLPYDESNSPDIIFGNVVGTEQSGVSGERV